MKRKLSPLLIAAILLVGAVVCGALSFAGDAAATSSAVGPELTIPEGIQAPAPGKVTVPVRFTGASSGVVFVIFSLDVDTECLAIDTSEGESPNDSIVFNLPPQFHGTAFYDADDVDGEIDVAIGDYAPPFSTLPDLDRLVEVTFAVLCVPDEGQTIIGPVRFSNQPAPSLSNTLGRDVIGTAEAGTVKIERATPTPEPSETPSPTPTPPPANTAPSAGDDLANTSEYHAVTIDVLANDSDPDGDPLTIVEHGQGILGAVTRLPTGALHYVPTPGKSGVDRFSYVIGDGRGGLAEGLVTVVVADVNLPPMAVDDVLFTDEDTPVSFFPLANDVDPDPGDPGASLTLVVFGQPRHGSVLLQETGAVLYTPAANFAGQDSFSYAVEDAQGAADVANITVSVAEVNDPPVLAPVASRTLAPGAQITLTLQAFDPDDELAELRFAAEGLPTGLVCDAQKGVIYGAIAPVCPGDYVVTVTVSDGEASTSTVFTITVPAANELAGPHVTANEQSVSVRWLTDNECNIQEFVVYRSVVVQGAEPVWQELGRLPAMYGAAGGPYLFEDTTALPGVLYVYRVLVPHRSGADEEHLSVAVMLGESHTVFLPLVLR